MSKPITAERRKRLDEEKAAFVRACDRQVEMLSMLALQLPGIDRVAAELSAVLVRLYDKYDPDASDGTVEKLHALILREWKKMPGTETDKKKLTVVRDRVVSFIEDKGAEVAEADKTRFVELISYALSAGAR